MRLPLRAAAAALALTLAVGACGQGSSGSTVDGGHPGAADASPTGPGDASDASKPSSGDASADTGAAQRVRIMAANCSSGNAQSYEAPGLHLLQGLAPDIVLIQELNYASGGPSALVQAALGKAYSFYVEPQTGGIPNGVISRYPILSAGVWTDASVTDRAFVYAKIDVPGPIDLWAVSVHLLTTGPTQRNTEAVQLVGYVKAQVPPGDDLVIGGDFNTDTTAEAALTTLSEVVTTSAPWPADQSGNTNTSINRNHPHDYVLSRPSLGARATAVRIGAASFAAGLVFDSRVYTPLGDVAPIVAGDSGATGMQHMPVVRDFLLGG